ncbi:MAG TPA: transglycosylase SLT domain-containing protein [Rhizobacter sp.]|nr:transglycosylase SLT domain-containing protein [Rhizobacter sp.]
MLLSVLAASLLLSTAPASAQTGNDVIVEAREALKKKDTRRLAALRATALAERHPLAQWVDYWELSNRLFAAAPSEIEAFYKRWSGTYVEDRLRNDWLLELGRRGDLKALAADYPRFRMNDDREVTCYAALADLQDGKDNRSAARAAWFNQRDAVDGCAQLGTALYAAGTLNENDAWRRARLAVEAGRPRTARQAALLVNPQAETEIGNAIDNPVRYLASTTPRTRQDKELITLALMRQAGSDPEAAAASLGSQWESALPKDLAAWAWAAVAKQAAIKLLPEASSYYQRADLLAAKATPAMEWPDETLAWKARAALRVGNGTAKPRWQQVVQAINDMSASEQREPTWVYWKARALQALAQDSTEPAPMLAQAQEMLTGIAGQLSFYGILAAEDLGQPLVLPEAPAPLTDDEKKAATREAGLARATQLITLGLRNEGVREWNFTLRGMDDRALMAASQYACERELWQQCINTSERTKAEVNVAQRYPLPYRREILGNARDTGLDPAYVYGLVRQESRFTADIRSSAGAGGLMQLMPATARWTAKKIGVSFNPEHVTQPDANLRLGTQYLSRVVEDFEGSQLLAAAGYNAGPNRPRRWREGPVMEAAAWAENVPFTETRDYVKKVLGNAVIYSQLLSGPATPSTAAPATPLKTRLGGTVGPRVGPVPAVEKDLP